MKHCKWCKKELSVSEIGGLSREKGGESCHGCWEVDSRLRMMPSSVLKKICKHHGYTLLDEGNMRSAAR